MEPEIKFEDEDVKKALEFLRGLGGDINEKFIKPYEEDMSKMMGGMEDNPVLKEAKDEIKKWVDLEKKGGGVDAAYAYQNVEKIGKCIHKIFEDKLGLKISEQSFWDGFRKEAGKKSESEKANDHIAKLYSEYFTAINSITKVPSEKLVNILDDILQKKIRALYKKVKGFVSDNEETKSEYYQQKAIEDSPPARSFLNWIFRKKAKPIDKKIEEASSKPIDKKIEIEEIDNKIKKAKVLMRSIKDVVDNSWNKERTKAIIAYSRAKKLVELKNKAESIGVRADVQRAYSFIIPSPEPRKQGYWS